LFLKSQQFCCWILGLLGLCSVIGQSSGITRTFYIAAREEEWDYCPGGHKLIETLYFVLSCRRASLFLQQGPHRIGHIYKKAVFRQYTDGSYTQEVPKPAWLGYLGPVLRAEVGDVMEIHMKNFAFRSYSMHPHGVFYEKNSEGALYPDKTSGALKLDDGVPPNGTHTYKWTVKPEYAPTEGDSNCLTWAYHSHVLASKDISSGLIGALLTCKKGNNYSQVQRTDVDQDFLLMFSVVDENLSWYLEENIHTFCSDPAGVDPEDPDFQHSNKMNAINGYVYGTLPGIKLCQNRTVAWHLVGMGNEVDVHSAFFHGHTLLMHGHRVDTVSLFPATFLTTEMTPYTAGTWLLNCQVNTHIQDGMQALFRVSPCGLQGDSMASLNGTVREYFIAAETVKWKYAPTGTDTLTNVSLTDSQRYVTRLQHMTTNHEHHFPFCFCSSLGPVLRAEVGDILLVTFLNNADRSYSIQPHGLQYMKEFEGAQYENGTEKNGSHVQPGKSFTYRWQVMEGPSESDPPCISYLYFSSSDPIRDTNSGLIGPLLVCKRGALSPNNTQRDVDHEFFLLFSILDENLSWYLEKNIQTHGTNESNQEDEAFMESNKMHAVNGYVYGNLPGLEMCEGDRIRWHLLGLGTEVDVHAVHFQGNTFNREGTTRDTLTLFPHTSLSVFMQPDTTGQFEVSCRVSEHYTGGMRLQYSVRSCKESVSAPAAVPTVHYFIAAEEQEWDYSPQRTWELQNFNTTEQDRLAEAEVGDVLEITFMNKASRPYSIQPHGVKTSPLHSQPVPPGNITRHQWIVPERSGPGISDPNCISFAYYSSVDFIKDTISGLIGPLVICRKGTLGPDRQRLDVDREFALLFFIFDENKSWYLEENIKTYYTGAKPLIRDGDFQESNKMHAINGKLYGNLNGLEMQKGERVNWYLLGMGSEVDMHTVHLHGQTFIYKTDLSHRADVFDLFPSSFQTVEMLADSEGTWLLHCHVADHIEAGMETTYTIQPRAGEMTALQLSSSLK
uniref:ferroxidase n=1 Tax=Astyanax mexicanus TaxID=7994 RepID=A0A8B9LW43_ASTMX